MFNIPRKPKSMREREREGRRRRRRRRRRKKEEDRVMKKKKFFTFSIWVDTLLLVEWYNHKC